MPVRSARRLFASCSTQALLSAGLKLGAAALFVAAGSQGLQTATANGDTRTISFRHLHTKEDITITFKREGRYDEAALKKLNWFMRDWRRDEAIEMDPQLFDLIWEASRALDAREAIQVVCGYRSSGTNEMLRKRSSGVAKSSLHTHGQAMDFYIPGVNLEELRNVGLRLQRGGVGFYPSSGSPFVHLDTGNVRHWPRMTHEQLVKVFPDGRTVHVGTDGQPLKNYALALADIEKRGGHVANVQLASANAARDEDAEASVTMDNDGRVINRSGGNVIARMFGFGRGADETQRSTPRGPALAARSSRPAPMPTPVPTTTFTAPAQIAQAQVAQAQTAPETTASIPLPQSRPVVLAEATPLPKPAPVRIAKVETRNEPGGETFAQRGYFGPVETGPELPPAAASGMTQVASANPLADAPAGEPAVQAMGYAPPEAANAAPVRARPMGDTAARNVPAPSTVKPAAPQLASETTTVTMTREELTAVIRTQRYHEPWLRAVMLTPSVHDNLTAAPTHTFDARRLRDTLRKPSSAVMMSFSADPNNGMTAERFSGSAIVFMATATFGSRTAALATTRFSSN